MAEGGDPDPRGLSGVEDRLTPFDLNRYIVNLQFDRLSHNHFMPGKMECWNFGFNDLTV